MIATVNDVLSHDVGDEAGSRSDAVFRLRAAGLMRSLLPVLDWLGTYKDFPLTIDAIRSAFEWQWVRALARQRLVLLQDRRSGDYREFCVAAEMPLALLLPVRDYLAEVERIVVMSGSAAPDDHEGERQHQLLTMYFMPGFTRLRCDIAHWIV
jgi:intracellular multiplication protein IcmO